MRARGAIVVTAVLAAALAPASPTQADPPRPSRAPAPFSVSPQAVREASLVSELTARLDLKPEQVVAAQALADSIVGLDSRAGLAVAARSGSQGPAPERFRRLAAAIHRWADGFDAATGAVDSFYATLSPDQRARFDADFGGGAFTAPQNAPVPEEDTRSVSRPDFTASAKVEPAWAVKPTGDAIARVYPSHALARNISGEAIIACTVDTLGFLKDCIVRSERPRGEGFGNAALEVTGYMRMTPALNYGTPVLGTVAIPLHFRPYPGGAAVTGSTPEPGPGPEPAVRSPGS